MILDLFMGSKGDISDQDEINNHGNQQQEEGPEMSRSCQKPIADVLYWFAEHPITRFNHAQDIGNVGIPKGGCWRSGHQSQLFCNQLEQLWKKMPCFDVARAQPASQLPRSCSQLSIQPSSRFPRGRWVKPGSWSSWIPWLEYKISTTTLVYKYIYIYVYHESWIIMVSTISAIILSVFLWLIPRMSS